jgi:hypothetical protein
MRLVCTPTKRTDRQACVETLEGRSLLSAAPIAASPAALHHAAKPVRVPPTITGAFTGLAGANFGDSPSNVRLTITSETSKGVLAGKLLMAGGNTTIDYPMAGTVGKLGNFNLHATTKGHHNTRISGKVSSDTNRLNGQYFGSMVAHRNPHTKFLIIRTVLPPAGTLITGSLADSTFKSSNWKTLHYGDSGSGTGAFTATGGDPGAGWHVTNNVGINYMSTDSFYKAAAYSPAFGGEVLSLTFQYDFVTSLTNAQGQGTAPAILQNGIVYVLDTPDYSYPQSWKAELWTNLTAADFVNRDEQAHHPDFSASGAPMQFGFTNANYGGVLSNRSTLSSFDNFAVTINAVAPAV